MHNTGAYISAIYYICVYIQYVSIYYATIESAIQAQVDLSYLFAH